MSSFTWIPVRLTHGRLTRAAMAERLRILDRHGRRMGRNAAAVGAALVIGAPSVASATQAAVPDPRHVVFFNLERDRIRQPGFREIAAIAGAQLKYTWRELEPERDRYDFARLQDDLAYLERHGKLLFVQVQDVSFEDGIVNVPPYLLTDPEFGGGVARKYRFDGDDESTAASDGWVARRWDPAVRRRFHRLLQALGNAFDGRLAGVTLAETAVDFGESGALHPAGFTVEGYVESVKATMTAARAAFPRSSVIVYANFMPGEWLPWTDRGYLRSVYRHADRVGVGVGGPDLLPHRKGQRDHSYPLIAARAPGTVAGVAVQWGNLDERNPATGERVTVIELVRFAREELRLDFIFWGTQEPHYSREILPYLRRSPAR